MPVIVVPVPVPAVVTLPGVRVTTHIPDAGSPLNATLPVANEQFVWVMDPIIGATGVGKIVADAVAVVIPHPPDAGIVYITVYVAAVLVPVVIDPVEALIDKPAGEAVKVPPGVPVCVTACIPELLHHGEPG
jgi:hypothetical protein